MFLLYNFILCLGSLLGLPVILFHLATTPKHRVGLKEKFGGLPQEVRKGLQNQKVIWLHAVSVGEVIAALSLIKELKCSFPKTKLVVSTGTATGNRTAREKAMVADYVIFAPFDYSWSVKRTLNILHPTLFVAMETELWPNLLWHLSKTGVPTLLANGRISPNSFKGYRKIRFFFRRVLSQINTFGMQTALDAQRLIQLGADPAKVKITGNVKFDQALAVKTASTAETSRLKESLGLREGEQLLIIGSTHRGEEEKVLEAFEEIRQEFPHLLLLIAPRHIERVKEIENLLQKKGLPTVRKSSLRPTSHWNGPLPRPIVLLDTLGELSYFYTIGTIAFVGGSLVPTGGQNLLEPAVHRKPVLYGPHTYNFQEIARILGESGGGIQVQDEGELAVKIIKLLRRPEQIKELGEKAYRAVVAHQGAVAKNLDLIRQMIQGAR